MTNTHPILAAAADIRTNLKSVADVNPGFMSTPDKAAAILELAAAECAVAELRLRVLSTAEDVALADGSRDQGAWLARASRQRLEDGRADQRLALALDRRYAQVAAGMAQGEVNPAQARVIVRTLDELPDELDPALLPKAEAHLVTLCADHDPRELSRLAAHLLEVLAPEIAEEAERKRLDKLDREARAKTRLTMRRLGDGTTRLSGLLPDDSATRLATYLNAFTNPRKNSAETPDPVVGASPSHGGDPWAKLPHPRRMGEAFVHLLEALDPTRLPIHGGDATAIVISTSLETLAEGLGTATFLGASTVPGDQPSSGRLTASQVRRLACNAKLIPAVLGTDSEVLDLGRATRLFTAAQRRALLLRDQTCRAAGCSIPGTWSEAHHWLPWSAGGDTDLDNAVLLCHHHHQRAHDDGYDSARHADGSVRFYRRS